MEAFFHTTLVVLALAFLAGLLWVGRQGRSVGSVAAAIPGAVIPIRLHFSVRCERGSIAALDVIHLSARSISASALPEFLTPDEARELAGYLRATADPNARERHPTGLVGGVKHFSVHLVRGPRRGYQVEIRVEIEPARDDRGNEYDRPPLRGRLSSTEAGRLASLLVSATRGDKPR